jgi:hypothetical protein
MSWCCCFGGKPKGDDEYRKLSEPLLPPQIVEEPIVEIEKPTTPIVTPPVAPPVAPVAPTTKQKRRSWRMMGASKKKQAGGAGGATQKRRFFGMRRGGNKKQNPSMEMQPQHDEVMGGIDGVAVHSSTEVPFDMADCGDADISQSEAVAIENVFTAEEQKIMEAEERAKEHRAMKMLGKAKVHAEGGIDKVLFLIHRSNNTNSIVYKGDAAKGVAVLWMMFEKGDPAPTEGLTYAEKKTAYGYKCKPLEGQANQWTLEMTALSDRKLFVSFTDGVWICRSTIDGAEGVILYAVHVEMKKNTYLPAVDYIEIFGENGAYERKKA